MEEPWEPPENEMFCLLPLMLFAASTDAAVKTTDQSAWYAW